MQVSEAFNDQITLNVGGALYTTTRTTLKNAPLPSLFSAMFSGRHILKPDEVCWQVQADATPGIMLATQVSLHVPLPCRP